MDHGTINEVNRAASNKPDMTHIAGDRSKKASGFEFYSDTLGSPRLVVAPMVDASELAWRLLSRRHGAELCYTPMIHSNVFCKDPKYRKDMLQTCAEDRPLIVQFCGNDPSIILAAALLAQDQCDAIDINLGCPQAIARRGHYGCFLQDEWELLQEIVSTLNKSLSVPVTCKIRVFEDLDKTIRYAKMLEAAGCQILTVHGRTRDQKGPLTGLANWEYIKAVRENVSIPVLANGNIQYIHDVDRCIQVTGVVGVMTAEGNLYNPALFEGSSPASWDVANEYLDLVSIHPCPSSYIRGHLFKLFQHIMCLPENSEQRDALAIAQNVTDYRRVVSEIKARYLPYHEGEVHWNQNGDGCVDNAEINVTTDLRSLLHDLTTEYKHHTVMCLPENSEQRDALAIAQNVTDYRRVVSEIKARYLPYYEGEVHWNQNGDGCVDNAEINVTTDLRLPPWLCQPYVRMAPEEHLQKVEQQRNNFSEMDAATKRQYEDADGNAISRKRMKKLRRIQRRPIRDPSCYKSRTGDKCLTCPNPIGDKCIYTLCKKCCRNKCFNENLDCTGHRIMVKSRREMAIEFAARRENGLNLSTMENNENQQVDIVNGVNIVQAKVVS